MKKNERVALVLDRCFVIAVFAYLSMTGMQWRAYAHYPILGRNLRYRIYYPNTKTEFKVYDIEMNGAFYRKGNLLFPTAASEGVDVGSLVSFPEHPESFDVKIRHTCTVCGAISPVIFHCPKCAAIICQNCVTVEGKREKMQYCPQCATKTSGSAISYPISRELKTKLLDAESTDTQQ